MDPAVETPAAPPQNKPRYNAVLLPYLLFRPLSGAVFLGATRACKAKTALTIPVTASYLKSMRHSVLVRAMKTEKETVE